MPAVRPKRARKGERNGEKLPIHCRKATARRHRCAEKSGEARPCGGEPTRERRGVETPRMLTAALRANAEKKSEEKTKRGEDHASLRVPSPCDSPRDYQKQREFPVWKRKNKTGQPSGRCRARGRNGKCCNFDGHSPDLVPSSRCGGDTEGLFCRCLVGTWLWHQWRSVLVMPLVPRLHAGSRHRPRLAHRRGGRSKWAHCRGSEETSPRFVAVGRGGVSKPMPFYDGGCGALLTCLCAKLGRNGRTSKPQGEKCVVVNRFFVSIKVALSKQRRKSCGVSAHGGGLFVGMVHSFLLLPCFFSSRGHASGRRGAYRL